MKVILKSDIERLGKTGEVVNVAAGYARNYLLPQGKALEASARNMEVIEIEKKNTTRTGIAGAGIDFRFMEPA